MSLDLASSQAVAALGALIAAVEKLLQTPGHEPSAVIVIEEDLRRARAAHKQATEAKNG